MFSTFCEASKEKPCLCYNTKTTQWKLKRKKQKTHSIKVAFSTKSLFWISFCDHNNWIVKRKKIKHFPVFPSFVIIRTYMTYCYPQKRDGNEGKLQCSCVCLGVFLFSFLWLKIGFNVQHTTHSNNTICLEKKNALKLQTVFLGCWRLSRSRACFQ